LDLLIFLKQQQQQQQQQQKLCYIWCVYCRQR